MVALMKAIFSLVFLISAGLAWGDPQLSSWVTADSAKYARIYTTDANKLASKVHDRMCR